MFVPEPLKRPYKGYVVEGSAEALAPHSDLWFAVAGVLLEKTRQLSSHGQPLPKLSPCLLGQRSRRVVRLGDCRDLGRSKSSVAFVLSSPDDRRVGDRHTSPRRRGSPQKRNP